MTTPQTPKQIASRVLELDEKTKLGPWEARTAAPELARAVIKAESDLAEMREENERLKKDIEKKDQELMDHAEDWALCGINPNSETAKKLVAHHHKREQERVELRDLRGKADGLAVALETFVGLPTQPHGDPSKWIFCVEVIPQYFAVAANALAAYRAAQGVEGEATPPSES